MQASLWNVPNTKQDMDIWSLANAVDHLEIINGIARKTSAVASIQLVSVGSGYTSAPTVEIAAPDQPGGTQATATAALSNGNVTFSITNGGEGYTIAPAVTLTGGGGAGATAQAVVNFIQLIDYQLDPIPSGNLVNWENVHFQMHTDMLNALNIQSSDFSGIDFSNKQDLEENIFDHVQDHLSARQALGI